MGNKTGFSAWINWTVWAFPLAVGVDLSWKQVSLSVGPLHVDYCWGDPNHD